MTGDASNEVSALIETLHETERRLEELTAGEVDTVADREGRPFLLRRAQDQLRDSEAVKQAAMLRDLRESEVGIKRLNRVYAVLSRINALIVRASRRDELFREACGIAVEDGGFLMAMIAMAEPGTKTIVPVATAGKDERLRASIARTRSSVADAPTTMVAQAIREKKTVVSNDTRGDPGVVFGSEYAESGVQSMAILPLIVSDEAVGALVLYAGESQFFHEDELKLLTELAGDISFAIGHIDRAQTFARLARIEAVMSGINAAIVRVRGRAQLFTEACRIAVEHGGFGMAWIGELNQNTLAITPVASAGVQAESLLARAQATARPDTPQGQGLVGTSIREKRAAFSNDIAAEPGGDRRRRKEVVRLGYHSAISLPLLVQGAAVGNLALFARERDFFSTDELKLLSEVAGNISFALEYIGKGEKITRLNRIEAVMSGINSVIVRVRDREELFSEACRVAVEQGGFGAAWIGIFDASAMETDEVASSGRQLHPRGARMRTDVANSRGLASRAIRERRVVFDNDIAAPSSAGGERRALSLQAGFRSQVALPFIVGGAVAGHLSLYAAEPEFFNESELKLLTDLAGNISFALEHIAREQKIVRLSRIHAVTGGINALIVRVRDRRELFDGACRIVVDGGQLPFAWIGLLDPATQDVTAVAWAGDDAEELTRARSSALAASPRGQGAVGRAIRERRPVFNNDIASHGLGGPRLKEILRLGFRSQITLPLFEGQTVVGTLTMYAREPDFFDEEERGLLTSLAGDLSFALENIGRQQKLDKLARIRAVSSEINAAIIRIHDGQALLTETCRIAVEHGKFELVWIAQIDQEKQKVLPVAWAGFSPDAAHAVTWGVIGAAQGTIGTAIRTRKPAMRNDIPTELPLGRLRQEALHKGCLSNVCLPLVVGDNVAGLVSLFAAGEGFFDAEELALLTELAGNISFALEHIQKEQKIARLSRIQALKGGINALIVRVRDRQELFEEACRIAVEHGGFGIAWIGVLNQETLEVTPTACAGVEAGSFFAGKVGTARPDTPRGQGMLGRAIREKRAMFSNDLTEGAGTDRERRTEAIRRGYRSGISLPLLVEGAAVGNLSLLASELNFFNTDELKLLDELAGDISFALQAIEKQEKLEYLSYYDVLTGLPNRTLFVDRLSQQMRSRGGEQQMVAVILLDIERFRHINDSLGHSGGDEILNSIAQRLGHAFNGKDYLARISSNGFGAIVRGMKDAAGVVHLIENEVFSCFKQPFLVSDRELRVSVKAGIAMFPVDGENADTLFGNAESALKRAQASSDRYRFYAAEMNAQAADAIAMEMRLRKAVDTRQFVLHYQPKIELATGHVCGLEALIRWNDPATGLVPPVKFIPILEETGMILEVGAWALQQAVADHARWAAQGLQPPRIAVNVSQIQLRHAGFVAMVVSAARAYANGPAGLALEITESLFMENFEECVQKLKAIRDMGIEIAVDDFGTGYSSLSYVSRLPVDALKIDRSFVVRMASDPDSMSIVSMVITLAHALKLKVVAEGVETEEQASTLKLLRCDEAQGYLFSRPLPGDRIEALLRERSDAGPSPETAAG